MYSSGLNLHSCASDWISLLSSSSLQLLLNELRMPHSVGLIFRSTPSTPCVPLEVLKMPDYQSLWTLEWTLSDLRVNNRKLCKTPEKAAVKRAANLHGEEFSGSPLACRLAWWAKRTLWSKWFFSGSKGPPVMFLGRSHFLLRFSWKSAWKRRAVLQRLFAKEVEPLASRSFLVGNSELEI